MNFTLINPRTWSFRTFASVAIASVALLPVIVPLTVFLSVLLSPILALLVFAWILLR